MPRGPATEDSTITTNEKAVFQSNIHLAANGIDAPSGGGALVTSPGDGDPFSLIEFSCTSGSAATLRVRIPGIHNASQYAFLKAGETKEFPHVRGPSRAPSGHAAYVSTASGTATYNYTIKM